MHACFRGRHSMAQMMSMWRIHWLSAVLWFLPVSDSRSACASTIIFPAFSLRRRCQANGTLIHFMVYDNPSPCWSTNPYPYVACNHLTSFNWIFSSPTFSSYPNGVILFHTATRSRWVRLIGSQLLRLSSIIQSAAYCGVVSWVGLGGLFPSRSGLNTCNNASCFYFDDA